MSQSSFITEFGRNSKKSEIIKNDEHKQYSYRDFRSDHQQGKKMNEPARIVEAKKNIQMYGMQVMNNLSELKNQIDPPFQSKRSYINGQLMSVKIEQKKQMSELMQLKQRLQQLQSKNMQSINKLDLLKMDIIRAQNELQRSKFRLNNLFADQREDPDNQKIKKQVELAKKQYSVANLQFMKCEREIKTVRDEISNESKFILLFQERIVEQNKVLFCLGSEAIELAQKYQERQRTGKSSIKAEDCKFQNENTKSKTSNRKSMNYYDE